MDERTTNERIMAFDPGGEIPWEIEAGDGVWPKDVEGYAQSKLAAYHAAQGRDAELALLELVAYIRQLKQDQIDGARRAQEWLDREAQAADAALRWEQDRAWDTYLEGLPPKRAYDAWVTYRQRYYDAPPEDQEAMHLP